MMMRRAGILLGACIAMSACYPTTTRPSFLPQATSQTAELEMRIPKAELIASATRTIALALHADSIPLRRTEPKDGWLESEWFDVQSLQPTNARRLGSEIVKVRGWIDPSSINHVSVTFEVVYRPLADPSRSERELEREVPAAHPIALRVQGLLRQLKRDYGGVTDSLSTALPVPKKKT